MRVFRLPLLTLSVAAALTGPALAQNNECAGALLVFSGSNGPFTNSGATTSAPAWPCGQGENDVWFLYVPPSGGSLTVDTCSPTTNYDTILEVFNGSGGCGSLVSLGCNDDSCSFQSSVSLPSVTACTPYYIRVGGFSSATGSFMLNINGPGGSNCSGLATTVPQGNGCVNSFASFREFFPTASAFDLGGNSITLTSTPGGYNVSRGGGTYRPVGFLGAPTVLALVDDSEIAAGSLGLWVGSNGWVATSSGNDTSWNVSVATMLDNPSTGWYAWHDMNPSLPGSGSVKYEQSGAMAHVTFDGVWDYGGTGPGDANNIQFQINTATGTVVICWGFVSGAGASGVGHLVGYSPGGPSADPGNTNLSSTAPFSTSLADQRALTLAGVGRPIQRSTAVTYGVTTQNIPTSALLHVGLVGLSNPGTSLASLGMPGCFLNASREIMVGPAVFPGQTFNWTALTLPALPPSFVGFQFLAQSAILGTPLNQAFGFGTLSSNGLRMTVGTF